MRSVFFFLLSAIAVVAADIRVVVWDEQQPRQKAAYKNFLGNAIADHLKTKPGLKVRSVRQDDPNKGIGADVLDHCDVLIWWGHVRQGQITPADCKPIIDRIKAGKLAFLPLHSAHWATPFIEAMNERTKADAAKLLRLMVADPLPIAGKWKRYQSFDGRPWWSNDRSYFLEGDLSWLEYQDQDGNRGWCRDDCRKQISHHK